MKKIILMGLFSLMFSQTKLETRIYQLPTMNFANWEYINIDLASITGFDLDFAYISLGKVNSFQWAYTQELTTVELKDMSSTFEEAGSTGQALQEYAISPQGWWHQISGASHITYNEFSDIYLYFKTVGSASFELVVTAEFPDMDTGYIEEGFDFCLHSGYNLVSFPCENPVSIETAIPENAQAELATIIGEGVASINLNGNWVGGLSDLSPGSGYWFKSNSNMCFNYTCAE